jgi:hypothetical protein
MESARPRGTADSPACDRETIAQSLTFHLGKEDTMLSTSSRKSRLLILGKILILAIIAAAVIRSFFFYKTADFVDTKCIIFFPGR